MENAMVGTDEEPKRLAALDAEADRVRRNTAACAQERIDARIRATLSSYASAPPEEIGKRIKRLDSEWPIDRALMTGVSANVLFGLIMGRWVHRAWYLQPAIVAIFLLQHTLQGWCPPLPVLRRLGFRTAKEIAFERNALKALRGDYDGLAAATVGIRERLEKTLLAAA